MDNKESSKLLTLLAFIIGYAFIDYLDTNEQNALGNFLMLTGQTLCTSASEGYRKNKLGQNTLTEQDIINLLKKSSQIFQDKVNKL